MTMEQLSMQTVKVQLSPTELQVFLHDTQDIDPNSPQMLRLISFLLAKSELYCEIPFSKTQVTVELLPASDGGLIFYFTCCEEADTKPRYHGKHIRLAGKFCQYSDLRECCRQILQNGIRCSDSSLYQISGSWILLLHLAGKYSGMAKHLLLEFGTLLPFSTLLRAGLEEHGTCIHRKQAAAKIVSDAK